MEMVFCCRGYGQLLSGTNFIFNGVSSQVQSRQWPPTFLVECIGIFKIVLILAIQIDKIGARTCFSFEMLLSTK